LALAGGATFLWVLTVGGAARAWQAWHVNFMYWTGLAQGLVVFAAIQKVAKGHWSGVVIRLAEAAVAFLFVSLLAYLAVFLGRAHIFSWLHEPRPDLSLARDEVLLPSQRRCLRAPHVALLAIRAPRHGPRRA